MHLVFQSQTLEQLSLRSKRSRTKRTKFGQRVTSRTSFSHSGRAKNGARAKRLKEGGGGGERRELFPSFPSPTPFLPSFCSAPFMTPLHGPNFVRLVRERLLRRLEQLGVFENVRVINDHYIFEEHLMQH